MWIRILSSCCLALMLTACTTYPPPNSGGIFKKPVVRDAAPRSSGDQLARMANLPNPKVVAVNPGKRGNGPIYTVLGKTYQVLPTAKGYRKEGNASWYGTKFHGRLTSSGEPFDMYQLTAAHKHLPIPAFARVTNLANGQSTIVRVNDRGPFHSNRIIDLSYAAAVKLGFHNSGTARVRVEVVEPVPAANRYMVQIGAYSQLGLADRSHARLQELTGLPGVVLRSGGDKLYRVQLGPVRQGPQLDRLQALLQRTDYGKPTLIPLPSS